jgi:hypothetical protein
VRDGVDERVEVERRKIRILGLDEHHVGGVVPGDHRTELLKFKV